MQLLLIIFYLFGILLIPGVNGARVLGIFPYNGHSHWIFFQPLMIALADRGHNVTVVGHFPLKFCKPGYTDIDLSASLQEVVNNISFDTVNEIGKIGSVAAHWDVLGYELCNLLMEYPEVQMLKNSSNNYDILITEIFGTECFQAFAYKFKIPIIGMMSSVMLPHAADMIDLPENPSYITSYGLPFTENMNFLQRTLNVISLLAYKLGNHYISRVSSEHIMRRHFPDAPSLLDISNNISLIISNSHFSINSAKPGVPALVEAAGLHIKQPRKLPQSLSQIFDQATHGVIYFCMGSLMRSETLPAETINSFITAFRSIPQTILWKLDGKIPENLPDNVIIRAWLPQLDVLCNQNVVAFITHGGMMGTQEAVYCGVPMIGIPLFGDQDQNIMNYKSRGFAVYVDVYNITVDVLIEALNEVVNNSIYKENALFYSKLFKDRPHSPLESAVYWTEYVIRYGGASHLRTSARHLNWFQYFLIDIIAAFLVVLYIWFQIATVIIKYINKLFDSMLKYVSKHKVE